MIQVCLTHDVDRVCKTYQYVTKTLKTMMRGRFGRSLKMLAKAFGQTEPYWGFDTIIDIENKYGVKSTLFFLEESAKVKWYKLSSYKIALGRYHVADPKVAEMIRYLDANGWEIGLHGSYFSYADAELLKKEKMTLEAVVGHPIMGIRQHYLHWNEQTWANQRKAGFAYDSTWGYLDAIGFKDDKVTPFYPIEGVPFCEIPLVIMDNCFEQVDDKWTQLEQIIQQAEKEKGAIVINFHSNNFDELEFPANKGNYIKLIEKLKEHNAEFLTLGELYNKLQY